MSAQFQDRNAARAAAPDRAAFPAPSPADGGDGIIASLHDAKVIVPFEVSDGGRVPADCADGSAAHLPEWFI